MSGVDWSSAMAFYAGEAGMLAGASEYVNASRTTIEATTAAKVIGRGAFAVGAVISTGEFIQNPTMEQGAKSTADIGFGAIGAFGGPIGLMISVPHFITEGLKSISPGVKNFIESSSIGGPTYVDSHGMYVCFVAGTLIYTEDGLKPIEKLQEGIKVYSYNFSTDSVELQTITKFFTREVQEIYEVHTSDERISVTAEHPFYVQGKEWVKVKDLVPGDRLQSEHGCEVAISSTNKTRKSVTVYNIEVAGNHNYFITSSKVLVHNKNVIELEDEKLENEDQPESEKE